MPQGDGQSLRQSFSRYARHVDIIAQIAAEVNAASAPG
jgi:hypothetical protein